VILKLGEQSPIAPWRLLFLVEGFPAVFVAAIAWNVIPDSPQTTPYLTAREKKVARLRLRHETEDSRSRKSFADGSSKGGSSSAGLAPREVLSVFLDPVAWLTTAIFFLANMAYSSLPVFLPTILTAMGHDVLWSQAFAAPPYLIAFIIVLGTARASDSTKTRAPYLIAHALASAAGYGFLALSEGHLPASSMLRYVAVYPAAVGFFNVVVLTVSWAVNNQPSVSRRGAGFALMQMIGQCGPLVGTRLYPDRDAPFYTRGMAVCAFAMLAVAALAAVLRIYLAAINKKLDRQQQNEAVAGDEEAEEEVGLVRGSASSSRSGRPSHAKSSFRYML
jgi:hypothetical protein